MNQETYEALKRVMKLIYKLDEEIQQEHYKDFNLIWHWIDEVAENFEGENRGFEAITKK